MIQGWILMELKRLTVQRLELHHLCNLFLVRMSTLPFLTMGLHTTNILREYFRVAPNLYIMSGGQRDLFVRLLVRATMTSSAQDKEAISERLFRC